MSNRLSAKKMEEFYAAIGKFVLTWASVELSLDLLVIVMRAQSSDSSAVRHELSEKIKFIRSAAALRSLSAQRPAIYKLIDEIGNLSETRHDYVHGSAVEY